jgi:hypothetical protein
MFVEGTAFSSGTFAYPLTSCTNPSAVMMAYTGHTGCCDTPRAASDLKSFKTVRIMPAILPDASRRLAVSGAAVVFLVFAAAIGVGLYHIIDPLLEFHVARQYRSAVIARALYLPYDSSLPEWACEIAILNADHGSQHSPRFARTLPAGVRWRAYRIATSACWWAAVRT